MHLAFLDDNISRQFHLLQLYTQSHCHIKLLNVPQQIQLVHIRMKYNRAFHLVLSLNLVHLDQSKDLVCFLHFANLLHSLLLQRLLQYSPLFHLIDLDMDRPLR